MENIMPDQIKSMLESLKTFWNQLIQFLPQLLVGVLLFVIGWIILLLLRKGIIKLFKLIRIDALAEKTGIENFLIKGGAQYTTVNVLANLIYWFLMFALTMAVLHSLGLDAAKELFNRILSYIPNLIVAVLVLIFGTLIAKLVRGASYTYLSNIRISGAEFISNIAYWAIIFLVVSVTLQQLSLGGQVLISAFEIAFGGLCLALAIAFGLAGKEWATQILEKLWRNSR
jgi:small-conductance mechanosensitive channel